jgi:hypothetical protein
MTTCCWEATAEVSRRVTDYPEALGWEEDPFKSEDEEFIRRFRKVYLMLSSTLTAGVCDARNMLTHKHTQIAVEKSVTCQLSTVFESPTDDY